MLAPCLCVWTSMLTFSTSRVFSGGCRKKNYTDFTVSMKAYELYNEYDLKLSEPTMYIYCMLQLNVFNQILKSKYTYMQKWCVPTDRDHRSQNSYTDLCNGVISYEAGYSGFCYPGMRKQTQTKCVRDLCALCDILRMFTFMLRSQYIYTGQTTQLPWSRGKTQIPPIGSPCQDKDGASSGISGLYLCVFPSTHTNPEITLQSLLI